MLGLRFFLLAEMWYHIIIGMWYHIIIRILGWVGVVSDKKSPILVVFANLAIIAAAFKVKSNNTKRSLVFIVWVISMFSLVSGLYKRCIGWRRQHAVAALTAITNQRNANHNLMV